MSKHPEVLWAQRSSETDESKNILFVKVNLPDIHADTLEYEVTPTSINFKAKAGSLATGSDSEYAFTLELFGEVVPDACKKRLTTRFLDIVLQKKELKLEYWPRLTKVKTPFIKTDFSKWVDEDEQDGPAAKDDLDMPDMGDMGMGGMGGMPGMGGMGGMPGMGGDMDFAKMMESMKEQGLGGSGEDKGADSDSDDDGPPPLEDVEESK